MNKPTRWETPYLVVWACRVWNQGGSVPTNWLFGCWCADRFSKLLRSISDWKVLLTVFYFQISTFPSLLLSTTRLSFTSNRFCIPQFHTSKAKSIKPTLHLINVAYFYKRSSDEGLTLETSAFQLVTVANLYFQLSWYNQITCYPHRRITTVSLDTFTPYFYKIWKRKQYTCIGSTQALRK